MLRRFIREDIELRIDRRAGPAASRIDRGHLEQIIVNLVVNARDAMPEGGDLTITTSIGETPPAPGARPVRSVVIDVRDTGVGMTDETQARLFEPFFTTKGAHGTGIGLATVMAIVRAAGGRIVVESAPGRGSTFRVYLPLADVEPARPAPAAPADAPLPRGHETILLVEDDPDLRELAREILDDCGYRVLVAPTGFDAIRLATEHQGTVDLLLTDVVMPHLSGPSVVTRVRRLAPGLRVLYMSGYTDETIAAQLASAELLEKPFDARSLATKVRQVLDARP
jgi:CheY-like chemotaxis protein